MRIGKASREAGVNVQTLRYYERRGLLPKTSRLASGYREYDPATVGLVRFIKNAQELGFTLKEIGELIALRANRSRSDEDVRHLTTKKVEEMDRADSAAHGNEGRTRRARRAVRFDEVQGKLRHHRRVR